MLHQKRVEQRLLYNFVVLKPFSEKNRQKAAIFKGLGDFSLNFVHGQLKYSKVEEQK